MHAYGFRVEDKQYYILTESPVKDRVIKNQGADKIATINKRIRKQYGLAKPDTYSVPFGTIFDENFEVVSSPEVTQTFDIRLVSTEEDNDTNDYLSLVDVTFIHLYRLDDRVMLGTRNSWDITNTYDLYEDFTYGEAFAKVLLDKELVFDDLPNGTYAFSHPLLHLTAQETALYSFTCDKIKDVSLEFKRATEESEEYIIYNPKGNVYYEYVSDEFIKLRRLMYSNRQRFRGVDYDQGHAEISVINCMLNYHCNAPREVTDYVKNNKLFNEYSHYCLKFVTNLIHRLKTIDANSKTYYNVDIPNGLRDKRNPATPLYYTFWRNVLSNAYHNNMSKGRWQLQPLIE